MAKTHNIEDILNNPNVIEVLPDNTAIAFHWVAREYGISIGEKNIERVKKFSQLEPQRTFYVIVHGLRDEQIDELNKSFGECSNVKVLKFNPEINEQYDIFDCLLLGKRIKLSQYWKDMYSEKERIRMDISNVIDLMKYHLAINSDQVVGKGKPLMVFDFDTLPIEGKKIGEVKIIKGGVLLALVPKGADRHSPNERLDLPIVAVQREDNQSLVKYAYHRSDHGLYRPSKDGTVCNALKSAIMEGNRNRVNELITDFEQDTDFEHNTKIIEQLTTFRGNIKIVCDNSWSCQQPISSARCDDKETSEQPVASHTTDTQPVTPTPAQQKQPVNGNSQSTKDVLKIPKTRVEAFVLLGLSSNASKENIKKAYQKYAFKWHPDKWSDKSEEEQKKATENFKAVNVAHKILTNEISEEFISKQTNDDWVAKFCNEWINRCRERERKLWKEYFGSHLSEEEIDLFKALFQQDLQKTKTLLLTVKNVNVHSKMVYAVYDDEAPLHYIVKNACKNPNQGWEKLLEEVLSNNSNVRYIEPVNVNIGYRGGTAPIHIASEHGRTDLIQILFKYGANVNKLDSIGDSPLCKAACGNHIKAVKLLLANKATLSNGESCIDSVLYGIVTKKYSQEVITTLLDFASPDEKEKITFIESCQTGSFSTPRGWAMIATGAIVGGVIGAILAATGVIPAIAAIGIIVTAVLTGIVGAFAGAVVGGGIGCLTTDIVINRCCSGANVQVAA